MTTTELYECWTLASKGDIFAQSKLTNYYISKFPTNTDVVIKKDYYTMYLNLTL